MMASGPYTKARRQAIVKAFALRNNGVFNPKRFLEEVREQGSNHPAYGWFEWNKDRAFDAYQLDQVRAFTQDLKVSFKVEEVGRVGPVRITERVMPLVMSPMAGRKDGGGYVLTNPNDPAHMAEHCRQAAIALRGWINRYDAALKHAGGSVEMVMSVVQTLEAAAPQVESAA